MERYKIDVLESCFIGIRKFILMDVFYENFSQFIGPPR